ncbi:hypothetical protein F4777DRAFT_538058 [Nemania sp. FL0916]|nr:hypothetical protein F4777DRAFT_538058 [Nemania sp. FL0916]
MANAQLMEEELQQSVVLSEEDAEFEEDDAIQDTTMTDNAPPPNPDPTLASNSVSSGYEEDQVDALEGDHEDKDEGDRDIDMDTQKNPSQKADQQDGSEAGSANNEDADHEGEESDSDEDLNDDDGAFDIDAESEVDEDEEGGFQPEPYAGSNRDSSGEEAEDAEEDEDEEEEDEAEGVGAVKIKPGETDEEDSESEPSDGSDSAFSIRDTGAESDEAVDHDEDDLDEDSDAVPPSLHDNEESGSDSEAGTPNENVDAEGDISMTGNDEMGGDISPSSARRASAPQLARDLLPPPRANKPDSHSMFNQLVLDEDPMDGSRVLRKRKTSSAEAEEDTISLRKRRKDTLDESDGETANERAQSGEMSTRPRSARALRQKVANPTCTIIKKTRSSLTVKMRVDAAGLDRILSRKPKSATNRRSGARTTTSHSVRAVASRNNIATSSVTEVQSTAPSFASGFSQPFYAFYDKDTDELKGKPYGGILTEEQADTTKTLPTKDDRRRFDEAKQKAEETWRNRLLTMQSEPELPAKKSKKASSPVSQIECIEFGGWEIDTWYAAPYPEEYSRNRVLYICEFCLKYMNSDYVAWRHKLKCPAKHPPGDEIYRHGSVSFFEVDGRKNPVYCQNLCLLAKLFLGSKTLYYDVEPFLFYVLCEYDDLGYHFVGYFSKEKRASSQNNVSCILTLPIHQRKGYGHLLIDFSYLLTRVEEKSGSPEKPLSDMGLVSYRNYWRLVLCKYLIEHVPEDKAQKKGTSIKQISDDTGMTPDDVVSALEALRFLVRDPATHVYAFRVDLPYCHKEVAKWEAKKYVRLKHQALTWTPYVMGRGNTTNFELGPALNAIAPRDEDDDTKTVEAIGDAVAAADISAVAESLIERRLSAIDQAVLESTEPSDIVTMETLIDTAPNGVIKEKTPSVRPSEQGDGQASARSIKDDEDGWQQRYESIPVTRFQVFPPISKRPGMSRANSSITRPATLPRAPSGIRTPAQPRSRPRPRRSTGSSVRKSTQKRSSTSKRKTGGTGRGPGRWPKGTKKSDYGNADSGPGLPPAWLEKQKPTLPFTVADDENEMHDTVQVQVNETNVKKGKQVETISARFEVRDEEDEDEDEEEDEEEERGREDEEEEEEEEDGDEEAEEEEEEEEEQASSESMIQSSAPSTADAKVNGDSEGLAGDGDIMMDQTDDYEDADAPGEEE